MEKDRSLETWKAVPGYEGRYEVSNCGNVNSLGPQSHGADVIPLVPLLRRGYLAIRLFKDSRQRQVTIHRLVMLAFVGEDPVRKYVNHIDGNKFNNHLSNLEWVTWRENYDHAVRTGLRQSMHDLQKLSPGASGKRNGRHTHPERTARGERSGSAKLREADIPIIRARLAAGETQLAIASDYGVLSAAIGDIQHGKTWRHVP